MYEPRFRKLVTRVVRIINKIEAEFLLNNSQACQASCIHAKFNSVKQQQLIQPTFGCIVSQRV